MAHLTFEEFARDEKAQDAVERCLQRISEAARKIGDAFDEKYPEIEFVKLRQMGSILRHDYDEVSVELIWDARPRLARLDAACSMELKG
jgi:uncharacterized protein with HEPN domain